MAQFEVVKGAEANKRFNKSRVHGVTREYMEYIKQLTKGSVGVLKPGKGETLNTLRNRVRRAADLLDIEIQTQKDGDELLVRLR